MTHTHTREPGFESTREKGSFSGIYLSVNATTTAKNQPTITQQIISGISPSLQPCITATRPIPSLLRNPSGNPSQQVLCCRQVEAKMWMAIQ